MHAVRTVALAVAAMLLAAGSASAVNGTWNVDASGNWSTATNWTGGIADGIGATANLTHFVSATRTVTIDGAAASRTLGTLNIGNTIGGNGYGYYLAASGGGTLTFDNGGATANIHKVSTDARDVINAPILLNDSLSVSNAAAGLTYYPLDIHGSITANSAGNKTISNGSSINCYVTISSSIADGGGGTVAIVQNSPGTMILYGNNTFTGGVTLSAGTLMLSTSEALGAAGSVLTITGGTLDSGFAGQILVNGNAVKINGDFTYKGLTGFLDLGGGAVSLGTTAGPTRTITVNGNTLDKYLMLRGSISDGTNAVPATALTKAGPGMLILAGDNSYSGATTISAGTVMFMQAASIGGTGRSVVVGAGTMAAGYAIDNAFLRRIDNSTPTTGVIALAADSNNNLDFSSDTTGANLPSAYLGAIGGHIYGGTLTPNGNSYLLGGAGGWLTMTKANAVTGAGNVLVVNGNVVLAAANDIGGATTINSACVLQLGTGRAGKNGSVASTSILNSGSLVFNNADSQTYSGNISNTGTLTKAGIGELALTGANKYSGATSVSDGTLTVSGPNGSIDASSAIMFNGGTLQLVNTNVAEAALNRVQDTAAITSNGGAIKFTNAAGSGIVYAESIGAVTLNNQYGGKFDISLTNDMNAGAGNKQTLTLAGLARVGTAGITMAVETFSSAGGLNATTNMIKVTDATATAAGRIIGTWATTGTTAALQSDYAIYDSDKNVVPANIAPSAQTTWTSYNNAYTLGAGGDTLSATRIITALRYSGSGGTLALGAYNIQTYGILNGGTGLLTISGTGVVRQPYTGATSLYLTTNSGGGDIAINAPITYNTGALTLVVSGGGTVTLAGATNLAAGPFAVDDGTLKISANFTSTAMGNMYVGSGNTAPAKLLITGGVTDVHMGTLNVGYNSCGGDQIKGHQIQIAGGTLSYKYLKVGYSDNVNAPGVATLTIDGTTAKVIGPASGGSITVGYGVGSIGTINIKNGGTLGGSNTYSFVNDFSLGQNGGVGIANQTGGTAYIAECAIGYGTDGIAFPVADGSGTYNISGGTLYVQSLGLSSSLFTSNGGGLTTGRADDGTLNLSGTGLVVSTGWVTVGRTPDVASTNGATGTLNIKGGELRQTQTFAQGVVMALTPDCRGVVNLSGGILAVNGPIKVGNTLRTSATFNFTGGTLKPYLANTLTLDATLGSVTQDATDNDSLLDVTGGNVEIDIDYTAAVSSGTHLATINVGAGKTFSLAAGKTLTIGNRATLKGAGTITSIDGTASMSVLAGGTVTPGDKPGPGTLIVGSGTNPVNVSLGSGAVYAWELGAASGDLVEVTGNLALGDNWTLKLVNAGITPNVHQVYDLFHYTGTYTGQTTFGWSNIDFSGVTWGSSQSSIFVNTDAKSVYITNIPEPASLSLLGLGGLAMLRRRRA